MSEMMETEPQPAADEPEKKMEEEIAKPPEEAKVSFFVFHLRLQNFVCVQHCFTKDVYGLQQTIGENFLGVLGCVSSSVLLINLCWSNWLSNSASSIMLY